MRTPLNHGDRLSQEKVGGDLEAKDEEKTKKKRRKDTEKTQRRHREGAEGGLTQ